MRLNKIKNLFVVLTLGLSTHSCLDLEPQEQLAKTNYWNAPGDYLLLTNQFYGWTRHFSGAMEYKSTKPVHSDYTSNLFTNKDKRNLFSNGSNAVQSADANYTNNYSYIRRTNLLLKSAGSYATPSDIARYMDEAKFFRAYSYFDLSQLYGSAILVKEPAEAIDARMYVKQNDRSEVVDFIIKDLKETVPLLPKFSGIQEYGHISREGCQTFLSRVVLYEDTWQKDRGNVERGKGLLDIAARAAKDAIDSETFGLFKPEALGDSAQKYMFILEGTKSNPIGLQESTNKGYIFARRFDEILAPINQNITQSSLYNTIWISHKFANMYLCQDGLPITYEEKTSPRFKGYMKIDDEFRNRDDRARYIVMRPHDNFWNNQKPRASWDGKDKNPYIPNFVPRTGTEYHNQKWATERKVKGRKESYDFPIIRYTEVLLNYAEAVYGRDDEIPNTGLNTSLNLARLCVNPVMTLLTNELITQNAGMDMWTEIHHERTIELFNEGFRLDNLKRWKTVEIEMPMDIVGIQWEGTGYEKAWAGCPYKTNAEGCIAVEKGHKWEEKNYLFPLSGNQLQLNSNLQQNPGWE